MRGRPGTNLQPMWVQYWPGPLTRGIFGRFRMGGMGGMGAVDIAAGGVVDSAAGEAHPGRHRSDTGLCAYVRFKHNRPLRICATAAPLVFICWRRILEYRGRQRATQAAGSAWVAWASTIESGSPLWRRRAVGGFARAHGLLRRTRPTRGVSWQRGALGSTKSSSLGAAARSGRTPPTRASRADSAELALRPPHRATATISAAASVWVLLEIPGNILCDHLRSRGGSTLWMRVDQPMIATLR